MPISTSASIKIWESSRNPKSFCLVVFECQKFDVGLLTSVRTNIKRPHELLPLFHVNTVKFEMYC